MATLVCFHAHPDDECINTGGSIARAAAEGHRVVLVVATGGEWGEIPDDLAEGESLADRRAKEVAASAEALGAHRVEFLGYEDSGMTGWEQNANPGSFMNAAVDEAAARLAAILQEENASTLTVYDWHGGYGHPDHIAVHEVGHRAAELAGTPFVYEATMNRDAMTRFFASLREMGIDPGWDPETGTDDGTPVGTPEAELTMAVDVSAFLTQKRASMAAHRSQISDTSFFLQMPDEAYLTSFGTEWFRRAKPAPTSAGFDEVWFGGLAVNQPLHVHTYGVPDGPPLLAIHGVSAHGQRFAPMAAAAFPSFRVIAPDLRGHGRSPAGECGRPVRIEEHLDDLLRVLDDAGVETVTVIGHSFGGCLGAHLLARAPERVASLVLLDPAIGLPPERTSESADLMITGDRSYATLDQLVEARRAGRSGPAVPHSDADTRLSAVQSDDGWRSPWDHAVVRQAWAEMSRPLPVLPVPRPTLLLDATQAQLVGSAQLAHFASELGDALRAERLDLGHMLFWDDFDTVCALIRNFVEPTPPVMP